VAESLETSVWVQHPLDRHGQEALEKCSITIAARRNPSVFVFRSLGTTIIVVFGSMLTALFMHPEEHSGDRAAVLYIAFLISLTNMATTDLGLGKVSSLLWYDLFNLLQLLLSLIAVAETMVVHLLFARNAAKLATHIDMVCRITLPALYVGETAGIFIVGVGGGRGLQTALGAALMVTFAVFLVPVTLVLVWRRATALQRHQEVCIASLKLIAPTDEAAYDAALERMFNAFDVDASGELDTDELRELFKALNPGIKRDDMSACVKVMSHHVDVATGTLSLPKFIDALVEGEEHLSTRLRQRGASEQEIFARTSRARLVSIEHKTSASAQTSAAADAASAGECLGAVTGTVSGTMRQAAASAQAALPGTLVGSLRMSAAKTCTRTPDYISATSASSSTDEANTQACSPAHGTSSIDISNSVEVL